MNKLTKYTETPEILDLQEALGVPETGIMDEQTISVLTQQITESGFAESKYFTEKLEQEEVKTTEEAEALLLEIAAEAILKEHYKCELEKIAKFMKECYDHKLKSKGLEVVEMEYNPEYHGSSEYQQIFEKGGRIYKFGGKKMLRYEEGDKFLTYGELENYAKSYLGGDQKLVDKALRRYSKFKGSDQNIIELNQKDGQLTFSNLVAPRRGFLARRTGLGADESALGKLTGSVGTSQRLNISEILGQAGKDLSSKNVFTEKEVEEEKNNCIYGESFTSKDGKFYKCVDGNYVESTPEENVKPEVADEPVVDTTPQGSSGNKVAVDPNVLKVQQGINKRFQTDENFRKYLESQGLSGKLYSGYDYGSDIVMEDGRLGKETSSIEGALAKYLQGLPEETKPELTSQPSDFSNQYEIFGGTKENVKGTPESFGATGLRTNQELSYDEKKAMFDKQYADLYEIKKQLNKLMYSGGEDKGTPVNVAEQYKAYVPYANKIGNELTRIRKQKEKNYSDKINFMEKARIQKLIDEAKGVLKAQGGTIFSKFKKGGVIEIPKKDLSSALKNVVGSGLKKKESTKLDLDNSAIFSSSTIIEDEKKLIEALVKTDSIEESEKIKASFARKYPYITAEYWEYIDEKAYKDKDMDDTKGMAKQLSGKPIYFKDAGGNTGQMRKSFKIGGKFQQGSTLNLASKFFTPTQTSIVTINNGSQQRVVDKNSPEYTKLIAEGWTEGNLVGTATQTPQFQSSLMGGTGTAFRNQKAVQAILTGQNPRIAMNTVNLAEQEDNLGLENQPLALEAPTKNESLQATFDRTNSLTNLLRTGIDVAVADKYRINAKPISSVYVPDVQTRLMTDMSPALRQMQQGFARTQTAANRFSDPNIQGAQSIAYLEQLNKNALDLQRAQIAEKNQNRDVQFQQEQQRGQAETMRDADISKQAQAIEASKKQSEAAMTRDLAQSVLGYGVGAGDQNDQAINTAVYNKCLDSISTKNPEIKSIVTKYNTLKEEYKNATGDRKKELQQEIDNLNSSYSSSIGSVEACFNNNIALARSSAAGLGNLGVRTATLELGGIIRKFAKGGKNPELEMYKSKVKKAIESEKNATKKDIATIKVLQDYYKMINKAQSEQNKVLSDTIKRIIK